MEKKILKSSQELADNPSLPNDTFDLKILDQLKDSGQFVNNVKEGTWIEYSVDSSLFGKNATIMLNHTSLNYSLGMILQKSIGTYINGKREGKWAIYQSFDKKLPLDWDKKSETVEYSSGLKNGIDTLYQGSGQYQTLLMITHYKDGIENGVGMIYNMRPPFKLKKVYLTTNGNPSLLKEYYDDGTMHFLINDTIVDEQQLKFLRTYDETGHLVQTGFYLNDSVIQGKWTTYYLNGQIESTKNYDSGLENGVYKYFHDNGQLWTELTIENGKVRDVISNFDRNGNPMDKGTLKDGNGTVIHYDEKGKVTIVETYKDGKVLK